MAVPYSLSKAAVTDILQCPDTVVTTNLFEKKPTIFLAGGISNCPNWQEIAIAELKGLVHGLVINPRRDDFDTTNPAESMFQIHWEHKALEMSDILMFWFPHDTLCPITLFELGKYLGSDKKIIIGADPEYARLMCRFNHRSCDRIFKCTQVLRQHCVTLSWRSWNGMPTIGRTLLRISYA